DLHLTRDGVVVVLHDPALSPKFHRLLPGFAGPDPAKTPLVSTLALEQLKGVAADRNPDITRFPHQDAAPTPAAALFAAENRFDPFSIPTLENWIGFMKAYVGSLGRSAGKSPQQQAWAIQVRLDLELKRVPFRPERIGDDFGGDSAGL